ncbi:MAG: hypothetical protein UZ21_OP11001000392 [Microgenomates bacterium OLB22]|nr:MAG: hypothetical protein UZ21_OP11001000392 [Microgenomates bacterium OLB22]
MPCIFVGNIPESECTYLGRDAGWIAKFYEEVAEVSGTQAADVELHLIPGTWMVFKQDGTKDKSHGLHVFILWNAGRSVEQKKALGNLIETFLSDYGLQTNLDITFFDMPPGTSFWFGGKMICAPSDLPPAA